MIISKEIFYQLIGNFADIVEELCPSDNIKLKYDSKKNEYRKGYRFTEDQIMSLDKDKFKETIDLLRIDIDEFDDYKVYNLFIIFTPDKLDEFIKNDNSDQDNIVEVNSDNMFDFIKSNDEKQTV